MLVTLATPESRTLKKAVYDPSMPQPRCWSSRRRRDRPRTKRQLIRLAQHTNLDASPTFRISLFLTRQICWMSAALWETSSSELPLTVNSSFWFFEISISTPFLIVTRLTIFCPTKLLPPPSQQTTTLERVKTSRVIPDLNVPETSLAVLLQVDVDGEMRVYVTHLVLVPLGDTGNQVVDDRFDGS